MPIKTTDKFDNRISLIYKKIESALFLLNSLFSRYIMIDSNKHFQDLLVRYLIVLTIFQSNLITGQICQNNIPDFFVSFYNKSDFSFYLSSFLVQC
jgi:hypothetical protein